MRLPFEHEHRPHCPEHGPEHGHHHHPHHGPEDHCPPPKPKLPPREEMKPGMLIMDMSRIIHDMMRENEKNLGIKSGYRTILFHLAKEEKGVTQLTLVNKTRLKAPTISITLQNMEREGLVERKPNPEDMRETLVALTPAGRSLDEVLYSSIKSVEAQVAGGLTKEEQETFIDLILKMRDGICKENKKS